MSYRVKRILPVAGMFALMCIVVVMVVTGADHEVKLPLPAALDNLAAVKLVEIRDAGGQVVLSGTLTNATEKDGDIEGKVTLTATNIDADAIGEAEVEVSTKKNGTVVKEMEVEVSKLTPTTTYNLFVDGQQAASLTTDHRGAAELELSNEPSS